MYRRALRDVIGRCVYGVDINPMSVELCKVSLWMEALEPGKPLSFLDHHIRAGNSLLGATPELVAAGLPDETFMPIEGDDKKACTVLKKRNKAEREGMGPLFAMQDTDTQSRLEQAAAAMEDLPDDRPEDIRAKDLAFRNLEQIEEYRHKKQLADAWCAGFVIKKHFQEPGREASASGITQGHLNELAHGRQLPEDLFAEAKRLSAQYQFFHWHLVFPEVYARDGFDCVLGNPPWERVKLQKEEWFAAHGRQDIANAPNAAARERLIRTLKDEDSTLYSVYQDSLRVADAESGFLELSYLRMFDMANDSDKFLSKPTTDSLPLYEAKFLWHYDHRFGSYDLKGVLKGKGGRGLPDMPLANHQNPRYTITPKYWVARNHIAERLGSSWDKGWLLSYRNISSAKLERTLVAAVLPLSKLGDTAPIIFLGPEQKMATHCFLAAFNSLVVDYIARQKIGGTHVSFFHVDQLPFPTPVDYGDEGDEFIRPRVLELCFTAQDMSVFASDLGWNGNPFRWDPDRRFAIQCELDAYFAHLYGLNREEWLFILDPHDIYGASYPGESFRVLKEKETERYGEFRTKRVCLQVYDELARARRVGANYCSIVDPPPGSPRVAW